MAGKKSPPKTETIEPYRARAKREITFLSMVIPAGGTFMTDQIPFDPKTMERID